MKYSDEYRYVDKASEVICVITMTDQLLIFLNIFIMWITAEPHWGKLLIQMFGILTSSPWKVPGCLESFKVVLQTYIEML